MMQKRIHVSAIGAAGAEIAGWSDLNQALTEEASYVPVTTEAAATLLSAAEKRRASVLTRLILAAAEQACPAPPPGLRAVFVSNTGDGATTHAICEALAAPQPVVSPMRFTNSVHNAAAAYWSIALRNTATTTSMSGGENGFSAALIEASLVMHQSNAPVLLVAYDAPFPFPLKDRVPARQPLALALILSPNGQGSGWRLTLSDEPADSLPAMLSPYFDCHVCAPGLIWLAAQAKNRTRRTVLPYLDHLAVVLEPADA
jgi:hypothetical protein